MGHMSELASEQQRYGYEIDFTRAYDEVISKLEEIKPGEAMRALQHALSMAELDIWLDEFERQNKNSKD